MFSIPKRGPVAGEKMQGSISNQGVKLFVEDTIHQHRVVVFSKSYCPYCAKAKRALAQFLDPKEIFVIELDLASLPFSAEAILEYLGSITGGRSVPRVFINGKFIGGGDDTQKLANNGELEKMLNQHQEL